MFILILFLFFLTAIHAYDNYVNYPGYDVAFYAGIQSTSDCMQACLNYNGCSYFTYTYSGQSCFLKNGMPRVGDSNYVSGPKMDYLYQGIFCLSW